MDLKFAFINTLETMTFAVIDILETSDHISACVNSLETIDDMFASINTMEVTDHLGIGNDWEIVG